MFRKILLAGAALATLGVPTAASAQYYGRSYGTYANGRHYYWDGHHYRDRNSNAVVDAIIAGVLGYAVGSLASSYQGYNRGYAYSYPGYGYSYPGYGYSNPYGSAYGYSYPYGSTYGYSYPGYGYSYPSYGYTYGYPYRR